MVPKDANKSFLNTSIDIQARKATEDKPSGILVEKA